MKQLLPFKSNRMVLLLWFVGYCDYFPSKLVSRIGGHPDWNRHVMYRAIEEGYVSVYRFKDKQRVIKSLRLTPRGLDYMSEHSVEALVLVAGRQQNRPDIKNNHDKIIRQHALATALVMAYNAGAEILPNAKPKLNAEKCVDKNTPGEDQRPYFYSAHEIRKIMKEDEPDSQPKTSRLAGVIVSGHRLYCMYYTGFSRMYWRNGNEDNMVNAIEGILARNGIRCTVCCQVIIGTRMDVATKLMRRNFCHTSRYFAITEAYDGCFFLENTVNGDKLLKLIIDAAYQHACNCFALQGYVPAGDAVRRYDAVTEDGDQPVILEYTCDLLRLTDMEDRIEGFEGNTIVLCFDYQADAVQKIVGPLVEVRTLRSDWDETATL